MMDYTFDLLEPSADLNTSLDVLTKRFSPLYTESWVQEKAMKHGNPPFDMNVNLFAQMWFSKALRIFLATDSKGEVQGYLVGMVFRPMTYQSAVFQIEDWYCRGGGVLVDKLFDHVYSVLKYIGIDEIQVSHSVSENYPLPPAGWKAAGNTIIDRFSKV